MILNNVRFTKASISAFLTPAFTWSITDGLDTRTVVVAFTVSLTLAVIMTSPSFLPRIFPVEETVATSVFEELHTQSAFALAGVTLASS